MTPQSEDTRSPTWAAEATSKDKKPSLLHRVRSVWRKERARFSELVDQIREDFRANGALDWTAPGFRAVAVHRFGVWAHEPSRARIPAAIGKLVYRVLYLHVRNHYTIELPVTTKVGRRLVIAHQGGIVIHFLSQIGDDCLIHQNVTLGAATVAAFTRAPILQNRVEVGCGAAIIGAVRIGDDVRIGPNAVVTMNVPAGSTVVAPAPRILNLKTSQTASERSPGNEPKH